MIDPCREVAIPLEAFNAWWRGRGIPQARHGLAMLLEEAGVELPQELIRRNLGLSLSDQYWIRPNGSGLAWGASTFSATLSSRFL